MSNPRSTNALNTELNNVARNTDDCGRARRLVAAGADLRSTNGAPWNHTPLHQASYHGRYEMARTLVELGAPLELTSNPCGRGGRGLPIDLARGGGHHRIVQTLEEASRRCTSARGSTPQTLQRASPAVSSRGRKVEEVDGTRHATRGTLADVASAAPTALQTRDGKVVRAEPNSGKVEEDEAAGLSARGAFLGTTSASAPHTHDGKVTRPQPSAPPPS